PMMDDLAEVYHDFRDQPAQLATTQLATKSPLMITLLPGSRSPEAYANWHIITEAINQVIATFPERSFIFFGAIAPGLSLDGFAQVLDRQGWQRDRQTRSQTQASSSQLPMINPQPMPAEILQFPITLTKGKATILLNQQQFAEFLDQGDLAIAMAGTATEQFVGLGKPAIAIPGQGPQFNPKFAEAQSRLLGESLILVEKPEQVGQVIKDLLKNNQWLETIRKNGYKRMGEPGAAKRIAKQIMQLWELRS
ncbi:MAG: lipid-A-disaccharide synthase-related protein, partial [Microcoleaceae cyanobacterium]